MKNFKTWLEASEIKPHLSLEGHYNINSAKQPVDGFTDKDSLGEMVYRNIMHGFKKIGGKVEKISDNRYQLTVQIPIDWRVDKAIVFFNKYKFYSGRRMMFGTYEETPNAVFTLLDHFERIALALEDYVKWNFVTNSYMSIFYDEQKSTRPKVYLTSWKYPKDSEGGGGGFGGGGGRNDPDNRPTLPPDPGYKLDKKPALTLAI